MRIVLIGPPGSGKGTQAELIAKRYHIPKISVGKMLRDEVEKNTDMGQKIKNKMGKGQLVPRKYSNGILAKFLRHHKDGYILDGYPRDLQQAKFLNSITRIDHAILIDTPKKISVERISGRRSCECGKVYHIKYKPPQKKGLCDRCGRKLHLRADDTPASVRKRFEIYKKQTGPAIEYFRKSGKLITVDGDLSIRGIFSQIKKSLKK